MSTVTFAPAEHVDAVVMPTCESCGAPAESGQLCQSCMRVFGSVLDTTTAPSRPTALTFAADGRAHSQPPQRPAPPAVSVQPGSRFADSVEADFPVFKQPWERKGLETPEISQTNADSEEPLPWWERQAAATDAAVQPEAVAARPASIPQPVMTPAPQHTASSLGAPPVHRPAVAPRPVRPVVRPPTPGAITRPPAPPSRVRPLLVLAVSLVVLGVAGVPVAKRWFRGTPTVTVSDLSEYPAQSQPAPSRDAGARPPVRQPVRTSVAPPQPSRLALAQTGGSAHRDAPARRPSARTERAAPAHVPATTGTLVAAAPPPPVVEPEPVPAPAPPPVEEEPVATGPVFEATQVDDKPRVASQVEPRVPDALRDGPLTDVVILRVLVAPSGRPAGVNVLRRSKAGTALDDAVVDAVRRWSFSPARKKGQAVSCWLNVGVPLRLEARTSP